MIKFIKIQFRQMKIKEIKNIYRELPLIVHKRRFLIPQKPTKPLNPYNQFLAAKKHIIKKQCDVKMTNALFQQKIKEYINSNDHDYLQIKANYAHDKADYLKVVAEYESKYLQPVKLMYERPYIQFIRENMVKGKTMTDLSKEWKKISQQEKSYFQNKCQAKKEEEMERYLAYLKKHEIPQIIHYNPRAQYLCEQFEKKKDNEQAKNFDRQYEQLREQQKERYKKISKQKHVQSLERRENFLKEWGISAEKLNYIRKICEQYRNLSKKHKMKKIISQLPTSSQDHADK